MKAGEVAEIYRVLELDGIDPVIDGGWCVDALLGHHTREHDDLDLAIDHKNEPKLKNWFESNGFSEVKRHDSSAWNYVMTDMDITLDIHICEYDQNGDITYGIEYPYGSLNGEGVIKGQTVRCITPEWMFKFKTSYEPKEKDIQDVQALSEKFGFELPENYRRDT